MNNKNIHTAVVILNWNGIDFLQKFIPVLIENTNSNIADIIVADNASTDNSVQYLQDNFPEIKLILLKENYGYAEGYNKAIAQLEHKYVVLINSDIEVSKNWLEPLIQQMDSDSNMAACQPKIRDFKQKEFLNMQVQQEDI
jgi:GT2 family glycosyltransferase